MDDWALRNHARRWVKRVALCASIVLSAWLMWLSMTARVGPWAGCISLAPLLVSIRLVGPLPAAGCGGLWGLSLYLISLLGGVPLVSAGLASVGLLVLVPAVYALLGSAITGSRVGFSPLLLAAGWVGVEYAVAPVAPRFGLLAGGVITGTFLQTVAGVLGYGFIAFAVAYANALVLWLLAEVRVSVPGPLFVPGPTDLGARFFPDVVPCISFRGSWAARPRAPPIR